MRIGILGTGVMASALAEAWTRRGHHILVGGRSREKARAIAEQLGDAVEAVDPAQVAKASDAVVVAVAWEGIDQVLDLAGAGEGSLTGKAVIDCTNAVDYADGLLKLPTGSAVEHIAERAVGSHVVKALHLFAGTSWLTPTPTGQPKRTVAMCGDDDAALDIAAELIRDLGGAPAVIGGLEHARQLEDVAGFVMRLVAAGHNPVTAVPVVDRSRD
ncbi:NAD(P)-binding domain-containing protein [Streptomyces sp. RKAG293]|uniref:NADPH-dependent F420 reductase n=1 Tax=Streptomyces sp. RKAG293 TaxID=2893403 RepID=UPI002033938A|nr:NAD(P)-binding domain-containing protein [Streptomyces sp. RKAG293]MCM2416803.1 NAD(P)-binding domain-containing protein [Streptomyces sp. RKAG293]